MGRKLNIEELFASKLEGLEQTPSPSVWKKTARNVRRKQFFRFKPGRLNIYYLVGMVVVGTVIAYYVTAEGAEETAEEVVVITAEDAEGNAEEVVETAAEEVETAEDAEEIAEEVVTVEDVIETAEDAKGDAKEEAKEDAKVVAKVDTTKKPVAHSEDTTPTKVSTMIPYFTPTVQSGCAPLTVTFINTSVNAAEFEWNVGIETNNTELRSPVVTYTNSGTYTVTLTATDQQGRTKSHATTITVYPSPMAKFEIDRGNIYNYATDADAFAWYIVPTSSQNALPSVPDPASLSRKGIHPFSTGFQPSLNEVSIANRHSDGVHLLLVATNAYGCMDTSMRQLPLPESPELVFPTVFSPNPDGSIGGYYNPNHSNNQVFHPNFSELPANYQLQVYNKAGELLFETTDIYIGWDGYYQETPAPRGVYIYLCTGRWKNGDSFQIRGDITVLRNEPY